jgi:hypothetical protein
VPEHNNRLAHDNKTVDRDRLLIAIVKRTVMMRARQCDQCNGTTSGHVAIQRRGKQNEHRHVLGAVIGEIEKHFIYEAA